MNNNMNSDEQIQRLYNATKNLNSPPELDAQILAKIRAFDEHSIAAESNKTGLYFAIAASILLVVLFQISDFNKTVNDSNTPIAMAPLPTVGNAIPKPQEIQRKQLPETFFLPNEDFNKRIVRACNAELITPEDNQDTDNQQDKKISKLPIKPIYPGNAFNKAPACDAVSSQILKK